MNKSFNWGLFWFFEILKVTRGFKILNGGKKVNANLVMSKSDFSLMLDDFSTYGTGVGTTNAGLPIQHYNFYGTGVQGSLRLYNAGCSIYRFNFYSQKINYAFKITVF